MKKFLLFTLLISLTSITYSQESFIGKSIEEISNAKTTIYNDEKALYVLKDHNTTELYCYDNEKIIYKYILVCANLDRQTVKDNYLSSYTNVDKDKEIWINENKGYKAKLLEISNHSLYKIIIKKDTN